MRRISPIARLARLEAEVAARAAHGAAVEAGRGGDARDLAARCLRDPAAFAAAERLSRAMLGRPRGWAHSDPECRALADELAALAGVPPRPDQHEEERG